MYDVITVGSATVDVFAKTEYSELIKINDGKVQKDFLAYPTGSKILVKELDVTVGGGGTNSAVALAKLGNRVAWLGKVGDDANGEFILKSLKKDKVDSLAVKGKGTSGYSMILDSIEHDRTILAYKGVNNDLSFKEVPLKSLKTKWFYFSSMLEESFKTQEKLAEFAKKNNIKIVFNASSYLAKKGPDYLKNILERTEVFILNKEESQMLVEKDSMKDLLKGLRALGPKIAVITNGKKEACAYDGRYMYTINPRKVKVLETTGAGDAFASSFLAGMIKKNDVGFAMQLGQTNAESVIQHHGAKTKLLTYKEAADIIKRFPSIVKKQKI